MFVGMIGTFRFLLSVFSFDQIASDFGRYERVLAKRASHRMTGLSALVAIVNFALFAHDRGGFFAAGLGRRTHLTFDRELARLGVTFDDIFQARILGETFHARFVHVDHTIALWTRQIRRVERARRQHGRRWRKLRLTALERHSRRGNYGLHRRQWLMIAYVARSAAATAATTTTTTAVNLLHLRRGTSMKDDAAVRLAENAQLVQVGHDRRAQVRHAQRSTHIVHVDRRRRGYTRLWT